MNSGVTTQGCKMIRVAGLLAFAIAFGTGTDSEAGELRLYVSPAGNDAWSGTLAEPNAQRSDGPLASLERARDEIRRRKKAGDLPRDGVTVLLGGGIYQRNQTFELGEEDSGTASLAAGGTASLAAGGTEQSRIVYRGQPGTEVRLIGGKCVEGFRPVSDPAVLKRLDPAARGKVLQADLKAQGVTDYGTPGGGAIELFFQERPMTLARWPNQGFVKITEVLGPTPVDVRGTKGCAEGILAYEGDRPGRWVDEKDVWLHGYWFWDWSDQRQKVEAIDLDRRTITLAKPYHGYGYRKGQWFYAFNVLAEIDQPGEWYLDRQAGTLYFWPPASIEPGQVIVSILPTLLRLKETSHVTVRGLTLEAVRDTAVVVSGGSHNRITGCTIRNGGRNAVSIRGRAHAVVGCDVYQMGEGGISLSGGDRTTLTPAGLVAENNHVHHYGRWKPMYSAGISISGVGNRVAHNLIHDAPHQAIGFSGNDHLIELNEIHSVCFESNDAGAIYAGRDWTMRGTVIRHNFMHHVYGFERRGCVGVYLDDMFCGTAITGNLFYRVPRAAFIGGGRDCLVENNLFVDCSPALHVDARALGWAGYHAEMWIKEGHEKGTLSGIRYKEPPYSERYPELVKILDDEPAAPKGNQVLHNVSFGGKWDGVYAEARKYQTIRDNLVDEDPHFSTPESIGPGKQPRAVDFALEADSPAWAIGFKRLPLEQMGLYQDETRASWPVVHEVRQ